MPGGGKNTRQTRAGASRDTKTKEKEVINNAFANLYSTSDVSSSEEEEEEYMEDTIEVAPGAPKANKVQPRTPSGSQRQKQKQKQEQEQSIGETTHLVEIVLSAMDELYSNIQEQRVHNEALRSEVSEIKATLAQPKVEEALRKEMSEVKAELARVVSLLKSTQSQAQAQAQAQAQSQTQQEKRSFAAVAWQPAQIPAQAPANREKGVTLSLGKAVATLKGKPLATIKDMAQKELQKLDATKGVKVEESVPLWESAWRSKQNPRSRQRLHGIIPNGLRLLERKPRLGK